MAEGFVPWTLDQVDCQGLPCHGSGDVVESYSASPLKCVKMCTGGFNAWSGGVGGWGVCNPVMDEHSIQGSSDIFSLSCYGNQTEINVIVMNH